MEPEDASDSDTAKTEPRSPKSKDLRLREQFFPNADAQLFDTSTKGYVPLPILLRKLLRHLSPAEVRVLLYLYTRASRYRLCYPTIEEIAADLGINRKNVTPHLNGLETKRLIMTRLAKGRRYFLMLDPRVALQHLVDRGDIEGEELFMLNELCVDLGRAQFEPKAEPVKVAPALETRS